MLPKDKYLEFHSMFYDVLVNPPSSKEPRQGEYISYDNYELPSETKTGPEWLAFHTMAGDFIRELKNEINSFLTDIDRLDAWLKIYEQCPEEYTFDFSVEILDSLERSLLHRPYIIQQRFIFISSTLLHKTQMFLEDDAKCRKPIDESQINRAYFCKQFKDKNALTNSHKLMKSVLEIAGLDFNESTRNFRNLDTHRIPPKIGVGLSPYVNVVERAVEDKSERTVDKSALFSISKRVGDRVIIHDFCMRQPLEISALPPILYKQHKICVKTFYVFWDWLTHLVERWRSETDVN